MCSQATCGKCRAITCSGSPASAARGLPGVLTDKRCTTR
jgi:hypothetical protein